MTWLITTTDTQRRQLWQHLFGRDTLPVLHPRPRWQWLPGREFEALAYDLDVAALHPMAVARLADYVGERAGWPYQYAKAAVEGGWPITAVNCSTVEKEKPVEDIESSPASFLQLPMFARQQVFISGSQSH
jgi:hypothetical protein